MASVKKILWKKEEAPLRVGWRLAIQLVILSIDVTLAVASRRRQIQTQ
jgi:hypothetical protein